MSKYIIRRLLTGIPVLFGVSVLVFSMMHLTPGDPVTLFSSPGDQLDTATILYLRELYHLNDPIPVQYLRWLGNVLRGDLGRSYFGNRPVLELILEQLGATLELMAAGMLIATILGVGLGILAALKRNSLMDNFSMILALFGVSMPTFWLGLMMILIFSLKLGWFPSNGTGTWKHLVLPAVALGLSRSAILARLVRAIMSEVLLQDYIVSARAKGMREHIVVLRHALRNVLIPVVTIVGLQVGSLISGAVIIETVFSRQGLGRLTVFSVLEKDFTLAQGTTLFTAMGYLLVNIVVDVSYAALDPRIHYD